MKDYIAFDVHKHYTLAERENIKTGEITRCRIEHSQGAIRSYLKNAKPGTNVAIEATGNYYWISDEVEDAGLNPLLVNPIRAKRMMCNGNKTDKLDVHGLNHLQRNKTLPTVWIPPKEIRDLRELPRTRMFLAGRRTQLKNRIQATLAKYGLQMHGFSDPFGKKARETMEELLKKLPHQTKYVTCELLNELDFIDEKMGRIEEIIDDLIEKTPEMQRLMTLPGVGRILSVVIMLEIGNINRFSSPSHLSSYSGCAPRVNSSGDKTRFGRLRGDVNRNLKWAFIEAANCFRLHMHNHERSRLFRIYNHIYHRKGHSKAIGAIARRIAESAWHVLMRNEDYKEPIYCRRVLTMGA